jgi:hypothetical protein
MARGGVCYDTERYMSSGNMSGEFIVRPSRVLGIFQIRLSFVSVFVCVFKACRSKGINIVLTFTHLSLIFLRNVPLFPPF